MNPESAHHDAVVARFTAIVDQVTNWDAPTPVPEWAARDVVEHLITWLPPVLEGWTGHRLPEVNEGPPAQRWKQHAAHVQALLEHPERSEAPATNGPFTGEPSRVVSNDQNLWMALGEVT